MVANSLLAAPRALAIASIRVGSWAAENEAITMAKMTFTILPAFTSPLRIRVVPKLKADGGLNRISIVL